MMIQHQLSGAVLSGSWGYFRSKKPKNFRLNREILKLGLY